VRQGRGHLADRVEAHHARELGVLLAQQLLVRAQRRARALALVDDDADEDAGGGQDEEERLQLDDAGGREVVPAQPAHHRDLGEREPRQRAVEAVAHGEGHHRQEEQVEELELVGFLDAEDVPGEDEQRAAERCDLQHADAAHRAKAAEARRVQPQDDRRHHRHPDQVADAEPQEADRGLRLAQRADRDKGEHLQRRDGGR